MFWELLARRHAGSPFALGKRKREAPLNRSPDLRGQEEGKTRQRTARRLPSARAFPSRLAGTVVSCGRSAFAYSCGAVADFHRLPVHAAARFCGLQTGTTRGASGCRTAWLSSENCGGREAKPTGARALSLSGLPSRSEASRGFLAGLLAYAVSGRPPSHSPL